MHAVVDPQALPVSQRIRWARKKAGLSQLRFAEALGTSPRHVIRWENGSVRPGRKYAARIIDVTGQPGLFDGDPDDEEPE